VTYVVQGRHGQKPQTVHVSVDSKGKGGGLVDRVFLFLTLFRLEEGEANAAVGGCIGGAGVSCTRGWDECIIQLFFLLDLDELA
jgi:hypothetical protein